MVNVDCWNSVPETLWFLFRANEMLILNENHVLVVRTALAHFELRTWKGLLISLIYYLFTDTAIPIGDFSRVEIQHIMEKMQATIPNGVEYIASKIQIQQIHVMQTNTLF